MISRRQFMVVGALGVAGVTAACSQSRSPSGVPAAPDLTMAAGETEIDLNGATLRTWAYGNQVPAREIRLRKGERLRATLTNAMPQDVTVHWHGIAIVNNMDGVPILTQDAVPNGQTFNYDFVVPMPEPTISIHMSAPNLTAACTGRRSSRTPTRRSNTTANSLSCWMIGSTAPARTPIRSSRSCAKRV